MSRPRQAVAWFPLVRAFKQWAGLEATRATEGLAKTPNRGGELPLTDREPNFRHELPRSPRVKQPAILVPVDFSPASLEAAKCGLKIARRMQGQMVLLHAVHLNLAPYSPANPAWLKDALCQEAAAKARDILGRAQADGVSAACIVEQGSPAAVIAKVAERCQAELIVMTRQPRGWLARLFGSRTAERVIREAKCPVMVLQLDGAKG